MRTLALVALLATAACSSGPPGPATLDTGHDTCRRCRMVVSDARFAAQIVAAGEDPLFFDDIGCLLAYRREHTTPDPGAIVYVADHRTAAWVPAGSAVYTSLAGASTPMGGGIVAHADEASRKADAITAGGTHLSASAVFDGSGGRR